MNREQVWGLMLSKIEQEPSRLVTDAIDLYNPRTYQIVQYLLATSAEALKDNQERKTYVEI